MSDQIQDLQLEHYKYVTELVTGSAPTAALS